LASSSSPSPASGRGAGRAVVGFDTATEDTAVCATRGGEVLYEALLGLGPDGGPRHSTALLAEVERAAAMAGGWEAVGALAVGLGPGSFTGIRIGLSTARGLAASTGLPLRGACTLDALGRALAERTASEGGPCSLAVLDARRGELFAALYTPAGERLWDPVVLRPEALGERLGGLGEAPLAAGSGAVRFRHELAGRGVLVPDDADPVHRVAARHICALADAEASEDGDGLAPIYLRPPDAARWRERDTSKRAE
jgi:tRNA threonylcarbamoyladenosine biosynthesis protein TsaB